MKSNWLIRASAVATIAGLTACGSHRQESPAAQPPEPAQAPDSVATADEDGVFSDNGGIVITGRALEDGPGTLLASMSGKVPNMRVHRIQNECPEIMLRSTVNFKGLVNPGVYVDGTRSTDTCVLDSLRSSDVSRVEVYPLGFTTRPGYGRHSHGLILVFMKSR